MGTEDTFAKLHEDLPASLGSSRLVHATKVPYDPLSGQVTQP